MNQPSLIPASNQTGRSAGLALASMIPGICRIARCLGPLAGIAAVMCGHRAQSKNKQSGGVMSDVRMATAGMITGYVLIALAFVMGMMVIIAVPRIVKARKQSEYNACVANLRLIDGIKATWAFENRLSNDALPADADLFGPSAPNKKAPACPAGGTYLLNAVRDCPSCSLHGTMQRR